MNKINFLFVVIVSGTVPDKGQITQDLISRDKTQLIDKRENQRLELYGDSALSLCFPLCMLASPQGC